MFPLRIPSTTEALLLVCLLTILSVARAQQGPTFNYNVCPNTTTFAPNSTYQTNLNQLLSSLSSNANQSDGFYNTTTGQNDASNTAYGLFLCRGDVTANTCENCASTASRQVLQRCPNETNAVIWYDECLLQYSNVSFFSTVQERPMIYMRNTANVTEQSSFSQLLGDTLRVLAGEASSGGGDKKFATKEANFTSFQTLHTLGQCTPDLSSEDCNRCLQIVIANLDICCGEKQGGRVLTPSCYIRFEMYPFYQAVASAPAPTPELTSKGKSKTPARTIIAIVVPVGIVLILLVLLCCWFLNRRARRKYSAVPERKVGISAAESMQFDLDTVKSATNYFSHENKLGEGGFGEVYKGTLPDGQYVAMKRLSSSSRQGAEQFKTEVVTMARLQHRNLVRLLGFCLDEDEKILIYEFVPNKSLDYYKRAESERGRQLDWSKRYKIIGGITQGILYLHVDSRLRIIHRDLKASNILLDIDLSPKIFDFGMAKIVGVDQTQANISRIVGTYGYMSPEYAMHEQFSFKSDLYSFGVLILEIISGKKNTTFYISDYAQDLITYAWKLWTEGRQLELLDPALKNSYSRDEAIRCIHIGLLCVQEDPVQRPTIQSILVMLESYSITLPAPQEPAFFTHARTNSNTPQTELLFDQSTSKSMPSSLEESVSEFYPR